MSWTDEEIDRLFKDGAQEQSFLYDPSYWEEFELSLPENGQRWSDKQIDNLFQLSAGKHSLEYKDAYWKEFEQTLPVNEEVWSDAKIDAVFQESAEGYVAEYQPAYWNEFAATLPVRRRRDLVWFFVAFTFMSAFGLLLIKNNEEIKLAENQNIGKSIVKNTVEPVKNTEQNTNEVQESQIGGAGWSDKIVNDRKHNPKQKESHNTSTDNENITGFVTETGTDGKDKTFAEQTEKPVSTDLITESSLSEEAPWEYEQLDINRVNYLDAIAPSIVRFHYAKGVNPRALYSVYAQGLGGLSQSLITPSDKLSYNYGIGLGFNMDYKRLSFAAGANFLISEHQDLELNRTAKVYGFGSTLYQFKMNYKQLYLLEGNIEFGYSFGANKIKFGIRPSYLLSTKVKIQQNDMKADMTVEESSETRVSYGFTEGMYRFGLKPQLGYSYSFGKGIDVGVNFGVQLMPMVNEEFINGENNKLPIDGQLYIRKCIRLTK